MRRSELARRLGGVLHGDDAEVTGFATDSREARPGDAFLAIRGEHVDGHDYLPLPDVIGVVERAVPGPYIHVSQLVNALARMGASFRAEFGGPVIGITGSAGKTTTKEFAAAALGVLGPVARTEGNRNTEYTAPLLWAELPPGVAGVVVEMGMRGPGQIAHLASFCRPTVGVITNVGWAHLEQLGSREGIAAAKGELFSHLSEGGTAIAWAEDEYLGTLIGAAGDHPLLTFGYGGNADLQITDVRPVSLQETHLEGVCQGETFMATIPARGRHVVLSAAAGLLAGVVAGVPLPEGAQALATARMPPLRVEMRCRKGATIVVDTYNASPPVVIAALEELTMPDLGSGRRVAILGPMRELGEASEEAHTDVGAALGRTPCEGVLYVPEGYESDMAALAAASTRAGRPPRLVRSLAEITEVLDELREGDTALLKASRAFALEEAL